MKTLATNDPSRATELLTQAPQLSYAIFQALLIMGLVSPDAINSVLEQPGAGGAPIPPPGAVPAVGAGYGTPPVVAGAGGYAPPVAAAAPAVAAAPVAAPAAAGGQDPEALMRAVMELPQETIDQLPEAERQQIMALRASYAAQTRR
jgi:cleavage stimulation factor subunit 2